uniref:Uncharacterized protein n=1 Tax=Photinus pyralis TaxID=7054 RepID=A0A1Y1JYP1_PHOPY
MLDLRGSQKRPGPGRHRTPTQTHTTLGSGFRRLDGPLRRHTYRLPPDSRDHGPLQHVGGGISSKGSSRSNSGQNPGTRGIRTLWFPESDHLRQRTAIHISDMGRGTSEVGSNALDDAHMAPAGEPRRTPEPRNQKGPPHSSGGTKPQRLGGRTTHCHVHVTYEEKRRYWTHAEPRAARLRPTQARRVESQGSTTSTDRRSPRGGRTDGAQEPGTIPQPVRELRASPHPVPSRRRSDGKIQGPTLRELSHEVHRSLHHRSAGGHKRVLDKARKRTGKGARTRSTPCTQPTHPGTSTGTSAKNHFTDATTEPPFATYVTPPGNRE